MADEADINSTINVQPNGADAGPQIALISQYVKDLSFENPNAPAVYQWPDQPQIDVQFNIGADKVAAVLATGAEIVATGNPGCMMQIGAGLLLEGSDIVARHPVELLDESYRRAGFYDGL